jgi:hypothetical protein
MRYVMLSLLMLPVAVRAQQIDIQPGARVRFNSVALAPERVTGTVISRTADSIVVATRAAVQYRLALTNAPDLAISLGRTRSDGAKKGFRWGAGISGSLMAILIAADGGDMSQPAPLIFTAITAATYGGFGAAIGAAVGSEKWSRYAVPNAGSVSPSFGVTPSGVRAGGHYQFR